VHNVARFGRAIVAAWIALLSTVAGAGRADAVAHGENVPDGKYAFAVKITDLGIPVLGGGTRDSYCSGGLISPHWVLTAGHCVRDAHDVRVSRPVALRTIATIGRADLAGGGGHDVRVIAVRQNRTVDVALAELDSAVTDVTPMRVGGSAPKVGQRVRLAGYGFTTATATRGPNRLRTGTVRVVSVARTTIGMSGVRPAKNTSPCLHDSGGPYFAEGRDGTATWAGTGTGAAALIRLTVGLRRRTGRRGRGTHRR
jgi:secreted trypsin-like serine protease